MVLFLVRRNLTQSYISCIIDKNNKIWYPSMKTNRTVFLIFLALGFLLFCARVPQQGVAKKLNAPTTDVSSEKIRDSVVLIENEIGIGSGFFVERDKIATNIHVVARPGRIFVKSPDNNKTKWTVEGVAAYDVKNDLAILKVKEKRTPLPLANSDTVQSGEFFLAAGFPDEKYKDTIATVVGKNQNGEKLIRLKSDLFPGNSLGPGYSGGPIINRKGQVVGICALGSEYHGYAIPSNVLKALLTRLEATEPLAQWQKRKLIQAYVYISQGQMELINKEYNNAITKFDKAIQLNPNFADSYYKRGFAKYNLGNHEGAIVDFEKGFKLDTQDRGSIEAYLTLGLIKLDRGSYEGAIADFDKVIRHVPKFVDTYHARAKAKFQLGNYEAAIVDLDNAIKIDPEDAELYNYRAVVKFGFGQSESKQWKTVKARYLYEEAIEDLTQAININPESHSFYGGRGIVKYNLGELESEEGNIAKARKLYEAAIIDFDILLHISSKSEDYYHYQRGLAKKTLGYYRSAIADFDESIRLNPKMAITYYERGLAKEAVGQKEAAKADFDKAKELDPNVGK